jgi:hypothetical protein
MIDSYAFGAMVIDGVRYYHDLIVLPDRVLAGWKRMEGHRLRWEDLGPAVETGRPESVIIGRGKFSRLVIEKEIGEILEKMGVTCVSASTGRAVRVYNERTASNIRCLGAFHLTC